MTPPRLRSPLITRRALVAGAVGGGALLVGCGEIPPTPDAGSPGGPTSTPRPSPGPTSVAAGNGPSPDPTATPDATATTSVSPTGAAPELPRGGRTLFPEYRLMGFCGYPGVEALGRLGIGDPDEQIEAGIDLGRSYTRQSSTSRSHTRGRRLMPVVELIGTVVQGSAGSDGQWRTRAPQATVDRFLQLARAHRALLLINIQPGRSDFLTEARHFEPWLRQPDVGLALDPEWAMGPGQVPGRVYGHTTGAELDTVASYLSELVHTYDLPEKAMVFHQVADQVVRHSSALRAHDGVALIKSVDGLGSGPAKINTYHALTADLPSWIRPGFKLFFEEDTRGGSTLLQPAEVLALDPRPDYVMYE